MKESTKETLRAVVLVTVLVAVNPWCWWYVATNLYAALFFGIPYYLYRLYSRRQRSQKNHSFREAQ